MDIVTTVAIGGRLHLLPPCGGVVWIREVQPEVRGTFRYVGYSINKASAAHILEMITWELSSWCRVPRGLALVTTLGCGRKFPGLERRGLWWHRPG